MDHMSGFSAIRSNLWSVYLSGVTFIKLRVRMDPVSGVSAINSTLSSVYLSGVTSDIITCSYGSNVRCICLEFYPV
jgi:hypothetical protein